jgi:hypothetical protein
MKNATRFCALCAGLLIFVCSLAGCRAKTQKVEANRAPVSGVVTLDGVPLTGGCITFISVVDPAIMMVTAIHEEGRFSVKNAPSGDVLVAVETESTKFGNPSAYVPIPKKYASVKTSRLKATITKSEGNEQPKPLEFNLKSK